MDAPPVSGASEGGGQIDLGIEIESAQVELPTGSNSHGDTVAPIEIGSGQKHLYPVPPHTLEAEGVSASAVLTALAMSNA